LLGFAGLVGAAALLGARSTKGGRSRWYRKLRKPAFQPPPEVFAPVWTVLYGLIAYSGYRVYRQPPSPERTRALALWAAQLGMNAIWTPLFFGKLGGKHHPRAALGDVVALTGAVAAYAATARKVDWVASAAVAPYLAWSSFATLLNEEIVRLNP
jgi:tryptophan-rich sensory protein